MKIPYYFPSNLDLVIKKNKNSVSRISRSFFVVMLTKEIYNLKTTLETSKNFHHELSILHVQASFRPYPRRINTGLNTGQLLVLLLVYLHIYDYIPLFLGN